MINNYIKVERFRDELVSGTVHGIVKKGDLIELYDSLDNPTGVYSHIEEISYFGIHYDSIEEGTLASFYIPNITSDLLYSGIKIVIVS